MLLALGDYIRGRSGLDIVSHILPIMIRNFGVRTIADCGGGIGSAAIAYEQLLRQNLSEGDFSRSLVVSYEPLPENFAELCEHARSLPNIKPRNVAVASARGEATFVVPRRMKGASAAWGNGTSPTGYLGSSSSHETVNVQVVRLDGEPYAFDYLKFDLQGGERDALDGLGEKARTARMLFVEQQLLGPPEAPASLPIEMLTDLGFVCAYDAVQFGFDHTKGEVPIKLRQEGGVEIVRVRPADGRGLPFLMNGVLRFTGNSRMSPAGSFDADYAAALKKAGVTWMATDIVAINSDVYPALMTSL